MTNTALQELITTYGDRIYAFGIDNSSILYIGYKAGVKLSDISLETIGGVDFVRVKRTANTHGKELKFDNLTVTECIQWVGIMDEDSNDYRPDPLILR